MGKVTLFCPTLLSAPCPSTPPPRQPEKRYLELPSLRDPQVLLKLHSHLEFQNLVSEGAEGPHCHVVAPMLSLLIWLEQRRDLPQSHVDVYGGCPLRTRVLLASWPGPPPPAAAAWSWEHPLGWVWDCGFTPS